MHGGMPCLRWSVLPEKMISMRQISVPGLLPQRSCRAPRITASKLMNELRERNRERPVMRSLQTVQQGLSSEYSYRQAFGRA
jgi:hypothetical protein